MTGRGAGKRQEDPQAEAGGRQADGVCDRTQRRRRRRSTDAKYKDGELSFSVTREGRDGQKMTSKYSGKLSGDTIKGKIEMPARGGGEARTLDWEAKRAEGLASALSESCSFSADTVTAPGEVVSARLFTARDYSLAARHEASSATGRGGPVGRLRLQRGCVCRPPISGLYDVSHTAHGSMNGNFKEDPERISAPR